MNSIAYTAPFYKGHLSSSTTETQSSTVETKLPDCFADHHAPKSVIELFTAWVQRADQTSNGVISINRQRQVYGRTTTSAAIKWLTSHRLMMKAERGGGRGVGSRYLVRWSFDHETLSARQNSVNHPETRITGHFDTFARVGAFKLLEEKPQSNKPSFDKSKTFKNVFVSESRKTVFASQNKHKRRLRNERSTRWALARVREITTDADVLTASAKAIRHVLASGQVFIGPELNRFVQELTSWVQDGEETEWEDGAQATFSYIGCAVKEGLSFVRWDRSKLAEQEVRELERAEAWRDPIDSFSCREYNATRAGYEPEAMNATGKIDKMLSQVLDRANEAGRKFREPHTLSRAAVKRHPNTATRPDVGKSGYQRIREKRGKVAGDLSQMLQEEGVKHISELIRREVATTGAVMRSDKHERCRSSETYQPGDLHSGAKRITPPAARRIQRERWGVEEYAGEPVNVADIMSGYLGKLKKEGVFADEVERTAAKQAADGQQDRTPGGPGAGLCGAEREQARGSVPSTRDLLESQIWRTGRGPVLKEEEGER